MHADRQAERRITERQRDCWRTGSVLERGVARIGFEAREQGVERAPAVEPADLDRRLGERWGHQQVDRVELALISARHVFKNANRSALGLGRGLGAALRKHQGCRFEVVFGRRPAQFLLNLCIGFGGAQAPQR